MLRSIVYKEWIKTRWFLLILTLLGLLAVGNIFLKVQHAITFNEAAKYWYLILFQNQLYFKGLKFIPILIGLVLAVAQYIPEIIDKRIKLSFHLPMKEYKVLLSMLAYGTVVMLLSFALLFGVFVILSHHFMAEEIVQAAVLSVIPWFLAGFAAYFLAGMVIMEAIWKYRIAYVLASGAFLVLFFEKGLAGAYAPINGMLALLTLLISLSLTFSAYRFRKGEM